MYFQIVSFPFVLFASVPQANNDEFVDRYMELAEDEIVGDIVVEGEEELEDVAERAVIITGRNVEHREQRAADRAV